jgi:uncharacterized protein (TIGR03083 family)
MTIWDDIATERLGIADVLEGLTDAQWQTPSLCGKWTVRELAGHLVVPFHTSMPAFVVAMVKAGGSFHRANDSLARAQSKRPTADLIADLRANATSHFTPPRQGPLAPLTDSLVHGQDLRIPLGINDSRDPEVWLQSLDFLVTPAARGSFTRPELPPVEFVATDLDWHVGAGPQVSGPAYAIALALTTRAASLDRLSGAGMDDLTRWMG